MITYLVMEVSWWEAPRRRQYHVNLYTLHGKNTRAMLRELLLSIYVTEIPRYAFSVVVFFLPQPHIPPRIEMHDAIRHIKSWLSQCNPDMGFETLTLGGHQC